MTIKFSELEWLAHQSIELRSGLSLTAQIPDYEEAPLSEIFELLESAVETYTAIAPNFSPQLRESAEQEIEFFYQLIQRQISGLLKQSHAGTLSVEAIAA